MLRFVLALLTLFVATPALPAFAMESLESAKASGMVGERPDGYLGAVTPAGKAVADSINAARRAEYERVAKQNSQPVAVVEKLMGEKLTGRAASGEFVMTPDGQWRKK